MLNYSPIYTFILGAAKNIDILILSRIQIEFMKVNKDLYNLWTFTNFVVTPLCHPYRVCEISERKTEPSDFYRPLLASVLIYKEFSAVRKTNKCRNNNANSIQISTSLCSQPCSINLELLCDQHLLMSRSFRVLIFSATARVERIVLLILKFPERKREKYLHAIDLDKLPWP